MPGPVFREPKEGVIVEDDLAQSREDFNYSEADRVLLDIRELIDKTELADLSKSIIFSDLRTHLTEDQFGQVSSALVSMRELNDEMFNISDKRDFGTIKKNSDQLVEVLNTLSKEIQNAGIEDIEGVETLLQAIESNASRYQSISDNYQHYLELNQKELEANFNESVLELVSELKQDKTPAETFQRAAATMQDIEQLRDSVKSSSNSDSNINEKIQPAIDKLKYIQETILIASVKDFDSAFVSGYNDILQKTRSSIHPEELQDLQAKHDLVTVQLNQFKQAFGNNAKLEVIEKRMNDRLNRFTQEVKIDQKEDTNKNYLLYEFNAILSNASIPLDKKGDAINNVIGKLPPDPSNLDHALTTLEQIQKNLNKQLDKNVSGILSKLSVTKEAIETIHKEKESADKVIDLDAVSSLPASDTNTPSSPRMR